MVESYMLKQDTNTLPGIEKLKSRTVYLLTNLHRDSIDPGHVTHCLSEGIHPWDSGHHHPQAYLTRLYQSLSHNGRQSTYKISTQNTLLFNYSQVNYSLLRASWHSAFFLALGTQS